MRTSLTFCGNNQYSINIDSEDAHFSVAIPFEALKHLHDRMSYFINLDEEREKEKKVVDAAYEYVWNPRSERHEKKTKDTGED